MNNTTRPLWIITAAVAALLLSACGPGVRRATQADTDRISAENAELKTMVSNLGTTTTTSTTVYQEPYYDSSDGTKESADADITTTTLSQAQWEAEMEAYCREFQANFDQEMAADGIPDGAFFYGDCTYGNMWGPVFQGNPGDEWTLRFIGDTYDYTNGVATIPFLPSDGVVPSDRKHPVYTDALTLTDMKRGTVVCRMYGTQPLGTFVVDGLAVHAFESGFKMPGWHFSGSDQLWSLEDDGVIPFEDGVWAVSRLVHGACPTN